jgi:hypothetical protein
MDALGKRLGYFVPTLHPDKTRKYQVIVPSMIPREPGDRIKT